MRVAYDNNIMYYYNDIVCSKNYISLSMVVSRTLQTHRTIRKVREVRVRP